MFFISLRFLIYTLKKEPIVPLFPRVLGVNEANYVHFIIMELNMQETILDYPIIHREDCY